MTDMIVEAIIDDKKHEICISNSWVSGDKVEVYRAESADWWDDTSTKVVETTMKELIKTYIEVQKKKSTYVEKPHNKTVTMTQEMLDAETAREIAEATRAHTTAVLTELDERERREARARQILEVKEIQDIPERLRNGRISHMTMARNGFGIYTGNIDGRSVEVFGYEHPYCIKCSEWIEKGQLFQKEPQLTRAGRKILRHVNCS